MQIPHIPVLLDEVVENFKEIDGYFIDATLGYGGHSEALLEANKNIKILGIDQDEEAREFSRKRLEEFGDRIKIYRGRYSEVVPKLLEKFPIKGLLADIGVSSLQLDKAERGFRFDSDVLDMRMDRTNPFTAYDVVNNYSQEQLKEIFYKYGEIRNAAKIAQEIIKNRPIKSAKELAAIASRVLPKKGKIHPATTLFQAIRIEVNQELIELEKLLDALELYKPKGAKIGIITFHSLEDRIVKQRFKEWAKKCICPPQSMRCECEGDHQLGMILTKKPIVATQEEIAQNPRSRSAKLRIFQFRDDNGTQR
ncbi:16S rRNA (cytosine(1402)-N(4))-methyltransferase RsmH [Nitratiruptor sp. YY09-18]|uniref:16S rRNA (cytosine(1402)-N(4))-methyltransferase RsmH n=1 Tax=Nitratiruptor sp. YY09-18 TaxID=2724901 RepID=UPI001916B2DA|nr:16S rRNA (cytosine(1402)-N(4))-methyltransferase RsmH [Nitratiruptor sp. YY09-18]BCD68231.1 16S rRNA (cytosine1402-N4)-methyltransferase [Nitratiruptor sp. YY09-18]